MKVHRFTFVLSLVGNLLPLVIFGQTPNDDFIDLLDKFGRPYREFTLGNGMEVLIIQDRNATFTSSALAVGVGAMSDPPDLQGFNHLLKHVVGKGTLLDGIYSETWLDYTVYRIRVQSDDLEGLLKDFAEDLFHPKFAKQDVTRQIHAVHLRYQQGVPDTRRKVNRLIKITSKPGHPFTFFHGGNMKSLSTEAVGEEENNLKEKLYEFQQINYVPWKMGLALIGNNNSLDELTEMVENSFGNWTRIGLAGKGVPQGLEVWEGPWGKDELGTRTEMAVPDGEGNVVYITFQVTENNQKAFDEYYAPLFNFRCSQCLYGYLDRKGWILKMHASTNRYFRNFQIAYVELSLTKFGFEHREEVVTAVFQYIALLKSEGPQEWFFRQHHALQYTKHLWESKTDPNNELFILELAEAMLLALGSKSTNSTKNVVNKLLQKEERDVEFPHDDIREALTYLVPKNMRLIELSPGFINKTNRYDEVYSIHYNFERLEPELLQKWSNANPSRDTTLPQPLNFYGISYAIVDNPSTLGNGSTGPEVEPKVIVSTKHSELWYKRNRKFDVPTTAVRGIIFSPHKPTTVWDNVLGYLLNHALQQCQNMWPSYPLYNDSLFGNTLSAKFENGNILIALNGSTKGSIPKLMKNLAVVLTKCKLEEPGLFERVKEQTRDWMLERVQNSACSRADERMVLREHYWSVEQEVAALEGLNLHDLELFRKRAFSQIRIHFLMYGKIEETEATQIIKKFEETILQAYKSKPISKDAVSLIQREIQIPKGSRVLLPLQSLQLGSNSTCVRILFQSDGETLKDEVYLRIIERVFSQIFWNYIFETWRYGFAAEIRASSRHLGFTVQGTGRPNPVEQKINELLQGYGSGMLRGFDHEKFLEEIASQKREWLGLESPTSLELEVDRLWKEMCYQGEQRGARELKVAILDSMSLGDIADFFDALIDKVTGRSVVFHVNAAQRVADDLGISENKTSTSELEYGGLREWKQKRMLLPIDMV